MHNIQYRQTAKGRDTRSILLGCIRPGEELTREEWAQRAGLSYEQVRRQAKNLSISGAILSTLKDGARHYRLNQKFKGTVGSFLIAFACGWSVPLMQSFSEVNHAETFARDRRLL